MQWLCHTLVKITCGFQRKTAFSIISVYLCSEQPVFKWSGIGVLILNLVFKLCPVTSEVHQIEAWEA